MTPNRASPAVPHSKLDVDEYDILLPRSIEWGTVILGYEQATKYTVHDENGNVSAAAHRAASAALTLQHVSRHTHAASTVCSA